MKRQVFIIEKKNLLIKIAIACFLILTAGGNLSAQYKGAPVQKERLLRVLQSKQLQTRHIVAIINSNGVDFQITPAIRKELIAAGARPAVIQAALGNYRGVSKSNAALGKVRDNKSIGGKSPTTSIIPPSYDDLLDQAMRYHKQTANPEEAMRVLREAALLEPENPLTYQMIGFVYLYGLNDFAYAEKSMRDTIRLGGSAVFRVNHDDDGKFTRMCEGSLYISRDGVRFESDSNAHTFETSKKNVSKINIDSLSTPLWDKRSVYQIVLRAGKNRAKFRFAPLTGKKTESEMVERLARWDGNSPNQNRKR